MRNRNPWFADGALFDELDIKRWQLYAFIFASLVLGFIMGFGIAPANAGPYAGPHCDVSARDYDSRMCSELPQNDSACSPYGDRDQCMSDWLDYQRQQHDYYRSTPN